MNEGPSMESPSLRVDSVALVAPTHEVVFLRGPSLQASDVDLPPGTLIGDPIFGVHPDDGAALRSAFVECLRRGTPATIPVRSVVENPVHENWGWENRGPFTCRLFPAKPSPGLPDGLVVILTTNHAFDLRPDETVHLTSRERDLLAGMAADLDTAGLADEWGVRQDTVRKTRARLLKKLGVRTSTAAVAWAIRNGVA